MTVPVVPRLRNWLLAAGLTLGLAAAGLLAPAPASAVPVQGHAGWSVLMCQFSDNTSHTQNPALNSAAAVRRFLLSRGTGGAADYFAQLSGGRMDMAGSTLTGWYTMPTRYADDASLSRWQRIQDCVSTAAAAGFHVPTGNRVIVFRNRCLDGGSAGGMVLLDPCAGNLAFTAHEMGHALGLGHSFSDDTSYQNAPWSAPGEYDDEWDLMSALHVITGPNPSYVSTPVGLNAYHLDKLGWIDRSHIRTWGADGTASGTVDLRPLYGAGPGTSLVRIPLDPGDLFHYLTVEYRYPTGQDSTIGAPSVQVHEVKGGTSYLLRKDNKRSPDQAYSTGGTSVQVVSAGGPTARVAISTDMVSRCLMGWVWRAARPSDLVCVSGQTRSQTAADNAAAASRWVDGPYGPHTCVYGYVWREAFAGDDVCVTGAVRSQAAQDNALAASRSNPNRAVYGPNTCAYGYVWRDGDGSDYVCVTGATRAQARADNAAAASRWVSGPYGPHTCTYGYVWREAWVGDDVCVTGAVRSQAAADDLAAGSHVLRPGG